MTLSEKTLGDYIEQWAALIPDKEFIVYSDRDLRFTYKQFNERVNNMAKGLMAIGVKKGTHVGIWATNVPDWFTFIFATAKIGAVMVTVNTNYKASEVEYVIDNADIHTLCITEGVFDGSYVDMTYNLVPELKTQQRGYINSKRFPYLKNVVFIGFVTFFIFYVIYVIPAYMLASTIFLTLLFYYSLVGIIQSSTK